MDIRFLGHAAFELSDGDTTVLIDPFLTGNPKAAVAADELNPQAILLTHGHVDHIGDTVAIAKRTGSDVVAIVEIADELGEDGVENVHDPNLGGTVSFDWGSVKLVPAWHTSTTPKGTVNTPAGLLVSSAARPIYHLGDTALFSDLQLVGERAGRDRRRADVHRRPLHDGPPSTPSRRRELIGAKQVIPCHYNTFPPIETDAQAFKSDVESARPREVVVLEPGETPLAMTMTHAIVLIEAERDALSTLGGELADIEGVAEAYSVTGEWDFVAIVRVPDHEQLADVVTGEIGGLPGVTRTQTMVAFAAYSRHDLEALFSLGE